MTTKTIHLLLNLSKGVLSKRMLCRATFLHSSYHCGTDIYPYLKYKSLQGNKSYGDHKVSSYLAYGR